MNDTTTVLALTNVADMARTRVREALKCTVEQEVLAHEPDIVGHSSHHDVTQQTLAGQDDDTSLAGSLWGAQGEPALMDLAKRLATLQVP